MKKTRLLSLLLAIVMMLGLFAACNNPETPGTDSPGSADSSSTPDTSEPTETTVFRVAALKGPTAMGMVKMLSDSEGATEGNVYEATIYGTPDEVSALLIGGDIDIAAVPANLASVLYNKTEGKVKVAAINTLGVLYVVENGETINSIEDLKGKTVYSTGQGTTPEFALNYILRENGIDPEADLTIEYKSESTEIAALLSSTDDDIIAVLPQPYVTTVQMQNESVRVALNLTEEWDVVADAESSLVTGVVVVRSEFLEENSDAFERFLSDYAASVDYVNANNADAAMLIEKYDIVKAAVAEKALPLCNITLIRGDEMKTLLKGYLAVLFDANPNAVGGNLPDEGFYYKAQ